MRLCAAHRSIVLLILLYCGETPPLPRASPNWGKLALLWPIRLLIYMKQSRPAEYIAFYCTAAAGSPWLIKPYWLYDYNSNPVQWEFINSCSSMGVLAIRVLRRSKQTRSHQRRSKNSRNPIQKKRVMIKAIHSLLSASARSRPSVSAWLLPNPSSWLPVDSGTGGL